MPGFGAWGLGRRDVLAENAIPLRDRLLTRILPLDGLKKTGWRWVISVSEPLHSHRRGTRRAPDHESPQPDHNGWGGCPLGESFGESVGERSLLQSRLGCRPRPDAAAAGHWRPPLSSAISEVTAIIVGYAVSLPGAWRMTASLHLPSCMRNPKMGPAAVASNYSP